MTDATDDDKALLLSDLSSIKNLLENPLDYDAGNIPTLHEVVAEPVIEPTPQFTSLSPRTATEKLFADSSLPNAQQQLGYLEQQALDSSQSLLKQKLEFYAQDLRKELLARYMPLLEEEFQQRLAQHLDKLVKQLT